VNFEVILEEFDANPLSYWNIKKSCKNKREKRIVYVNGVKSCNLNSDLASNKEELEKITNLHGKDSMKEYINKLIPGSFGLLYDFELTSPYFSKDDDEFYIIDNPIMKEKVWKVPMLRGSSWKGALLKAARKTMSALLETGSVEEIFNHYLSMMRIFGTGSDDFRKVEEKIKKFIHDRSEEDEKTLTKQLMGYALKELGLNLNIKKNNQTIAEQIFEQIIKQGEEAEESGHENFYEVRKGRAIFYPTYFDRLSLEIINPHNRRTKAGTQPIYYEVVPGDCKGTLRIIYIPYDAITAPMEELKNQVRFDCNFLKQLIVKVFEETGIGAKTKLGWGKATIREKNCFANMEGICDE